MADYKERPLTGKSWQRVNRLVVENPYQQSPYVNVCEQEAYQIGDDVAFKDLGVTMAATFEPAETIQLRNPLTDELLGATATHADIQVLLYSLTRHMQEQRDAAQE